jgi:aspartate racemase
MRTIGLIGGMSWESSLEYYRLLNEGVKQRLGGFHSAACVMVSVDFAEIEAYQESGDWLAAGKALGQAALALERGGAECVVLCTNTMHKVADAIQSSVRIPLLHIADATGRAVQAQGLRRVGLLGTRFTMEEAFYAERLREGFGLQVVIPQADDRQEVHRVIYEELVLGVVWEVSRQAYKGVIQRLAQNGAQGVILGCTEIGLLVKPEDSPLPVFDTTRIHAHAAVDFALS